MPSFFETNRVNSHGHDGRSYSSKPGVPVKIYLKLPSELSPVARLQQRCPAGGALMEMNGWFRSLNL